MKDDRKQTFEESFEHLDEKILAEFAGSETDPAPARKTFFARFTSHPVRVAACAVFALAFVIAGAMLLRSANTAPRDGANAFSQAESATEEEYYTETSYVPIPLDKDTWITPTEDGVFGEDYIYDFSEPETEKIENAPLTTVRLGAKEIEAYRTETVRGTDATSRDGFQTADDMYKFWKYKYNSSFYISGMDTKTALSDYPYSELTEERLYDHVVAYIRSFLPDIKIEKYVLSVNTRLTVTAEDSAWSDTKDGFYIGRETENTKESVTGYNYTFALYCNGIPTGDFVHVLCGPDGAVLSLRYSCFDVDWSAAKYDLEKSRKKALAFAASALNDRYSVKSAKTVSERLNYENGFFRLQFDVELVTNEGFATLCTVIITP